MAVSSQLPEVPWGVETDKTVRDVFQSHLPPGRPPSVFSISDFCLQQVTVDN